MKLWSQNHNSVCLVFGLTNGPKAMILRMHSKVKRAVKVMFKYFSMDSYQTGAS